MEPVTFGGIEVDRCTDCHGLFFDEFEKEQLRTRKGAAAIDSGDANVGREFNAVDCINGSKSAPRPVLMTVRP